MASDNLQKFNNNTLTILRKEKYKDPYGGVLYNDVKQDWDIPCRIYDYNGRWTIDFEGESFPVSQKMICDKDVNIIAGDKVKDFKTDQEYLVLVVKPIYGKYEINHLECSLAEV